MSTQDATFCEMLRVSLHSHFEVGIRQWSHEDMQDELEMLRELPEAKQPLIWDSEMSFLVHSAINRYENTLHAKRQTGAPKTVPSLAGVAKLINLLQRGKEEKRSHKSLKPSVSFQGLTSQASSMNNNTCLGTGAVSSSVVQARKRNRVMRHWTYPLSSRTSM
jgi:hypothetical protein